METKNATYNTFIFDLDGTLLHTVPDLTRYTNDVLARFGYPTHTQDEILSYVGNGGLSLIVQAVPANTPEEKVKTIFEEWKSGLLSYSNMLTKPFDGIPETLYALKQSGAKLGVLSNKFEGGVYQIIEQCLPNMFDVLHGECDEIPRKPNPQGLFTTMRELGAEAHTTLYIGDSPGDMLVAQNAKLSSVAVSWGYYSAEELLEYNPTYTLTTPADLLAFIE